MSDHVSLMTSSDWLAPHRCERIQLGLGVIRPGCTVTSSSGAMIQSGLESVTLFSSYFKARLNWKVAGEFLLLQTQIKSFSQLLPSFAWVVVWLCQQLSGTFVVCGLTSCQSKVRKAKLGNKRHNIRSRRIWLTAIFVGARNKTTRRYLGDL